MDTKFEDTSSHRSRDENFIGEKEKKKKWANKRNDEYEDANSLLHNSYIKFVSIFKILVAVVPEIFYEKKKKNNNKKHADTQTDKQMLLRKRRKLYNQPTLFTSYAGRIDICCGRLMYL